MDKLPPQILTAIMSYLDNYSIYYLLLGIKSESINWNSVLEYKYIDYKDINKKYIEYKGLRILKPEYAHLILSNILKK